MSLGQHLTDLLRQALGYNGSLAVLVDDAKTIPSAFLYQGPIAAFYNDPSALGPFLGKPAAVGVVGYFCILPPIRGHPSLGVCCVHPVQEPHCTILSKTKSLTRRAL